MLKNKGCQGTTPDRKDRLVLLRKHLKNKISLLFFFIGMGLLFILMRRVGLSEIAASLKQLKYQILYILILPVSWYFIQSVAWWRVLADDGIRVALWHVFLTKITGEAINTMTPASFMGGDPFRIYLLQKKIALTHSASSVIIDRTMYMFAVFLLLLVTFFVAWFALPLPPVWRVFFPVFTAGFLVVFVILVFFQKRGLVGGITGLIKKLGIKRERLDSLSHKIDEVDAQVGAFYRKHKLHFFEIMGLQFAGKFLGVVEIYLIAVLLGFPVTFIQCFFIASLTVLINIMFVFVPGSLGVMEGGYGALFYLMQLYPALGVMIQLVRRIRQIFWMGMGLMIILFYRPKSNWLSPSP